MPNTDALVWGIVAHLVADWLLQNAWMADNKASLRHPAAWVHGTIHLAAQTLVFSWPVAIALAVVHMLIDTRVPLQWWRKTIRQTTEGPMAIHVALWTDQVLHILCLAVAVLLGAR